MRLRRFYVREYRVLRDLEIQFHPDLGGADQQTPYGLEFLVGLNGSGKSTVIQALAEIFRRLEANPLVPFEFRLEYEVGAGDHRRQVVLHSQRAEDQPHAQSGEVVVQVDGASKPWSQDLAPTAIVAFTTGNEDEWELLGKARGAEDAEGISRISSEERAIRELPGWDAPVDRVDGKGDGQSSSFRLIRHTELSLVTLCGLLEFLAQRREAREEGLAKVLDQSGIVPPCGYSLRFRLNPGLVKPSEQDVFDRLRRFAKRALRLGPDRLLVFDLAEDANVRTLLDEFGGGYELFKALSRLQRSPVQAERTLQEVSIFLERRPEPVPEGAEPQQPPLHLLAWLSDGEQSFLGRMCLFTLLRQPDALILLDEPEVHFNDYWKRQIVSLLDGVLRGRDSHVLITTHSSITLSDVPREDIVYLDRPGAYTLRSQTPSFQTLAADPSDIMVHVFGAPHAAGQRAVSHISRSLEEISGEPSVARRRERLKRLQEQVGPGYWSYRIRRETAALEQPP